MGRLNLVILDKNVRYLENLSGFILDNYSRRFNLYTYSDIETFLKNMEDTKTTPDIIAVSRDIFSNRLMNFETGLVLVICEGGRGKYEGLDTLDRYTDADSFVSGILKYYAEKNDSGSEQAAKGILDTKVSVVISPSGGSGKTSLSLGLCSLLSRTRPSVLYFNLDRTDPNGKVYDPDCKSGGMSDIIFAIKSRREKLPILLETLKLDFDGERFSYYTPPIFPMDIDELSTDEIEFLLESLRNIGIYSHIIIDTHSGFSLVNKVLMELSDNIFIIINNTATEIKKLINLREQMDRVYKTKSSFMYKRICVLLNKTNKDTYSPEVENYISTQTFRSKIKTLPYSAEIFDLYEANRLSDIKNDFGCALTEVVQGYQS